MHRFDLLIFDMDGVLVDTSPCHRRAYRDLWRKIGIEGPQYEVIAGRKTSEVVVEFTKELKPSAAQIYEWVLFKQLQARKYLSIEVITYPDSFSCLLTLARHKILMALGTAASHTTAHIVLSRLDIGNFFSIIVTAEDVENGKPAPEIYLRIIAEAAVSPCKTLVIEDSSSGLEAAIASKAYVASVRTGKKIKDPRFVGTFSDLDELLLGIGIDPS